LPISANSTAILPGFGGKHDTPFTVFEVVTTGMQWNFFLWWEAVK
jgi:hypothetical protein